MRASAQIPVDALRFLGRSSRRRRRPPAGASPGDMVVPEDAARPVIRVMAYGSDGLEERTLEDASQVKEVAAGAGTVWFDIEGFGDRAILEEVAGSLGIHPLAMADVVHVPQRPKAELYAERLLIVLQMARVSEAGHVEIEQVSLVLGPNWVATFQESPGDVFDPVRARIRSGVTRIRTMGADYLAYALTDAVVDGYFPVVEALADVIDALEEEVVESPTRACLARIHATRRTLLTLHRVQWRQRDAISSLLRDVEFPFSETVRLYLRDAHDHAFQTLDAIETHRDMVVGLMDLHLSSASNRLNEVMKTLTIVATIFIPLTFLAGVYGMNFRYMPELQWRWGYPAVWAVMVVLGVGLLGWFRLRGWIGTPSADGETDDDEDRFRDGDR